MERPKRGISPQEEKKRIRCMAEQKKKGGGECTKIGTEERKSLQKNPNYGLGGGRRGKGKDKRIHCGDEKEPPFNKLKDEEREKSLALIKEKKDPFPPSKTQLKKKKKGEATGCCGCQWEKGEPDFLTSKGET